MKPGEQLIVVSWRSVPVSLIDDVERWVPTLAVRAAALDRDGAFPAEDIAGLHAMGALVAPLPVALGGIGAGIEASGGTAILRLMLALGRGNLAVARLFEAHVNALRLIMRFGDEAAQAAAAADARAGQLYGLWVTDAGGEAVTAVGSRLTGSKGPCSGAGYCTRALITARVGEATRMAVVALAGSEAVVPLQGMQGMRASVNGRVDLSGVMVRDWIGAAEDYLREPDFSCGAWRASAAAAGAIAGLVDGVGNVLRRRRQVDAPMQLARFAEMLMARETALLWVERMASIAEADGDPAVQVATVNLGRGAVERAGLDAIRLAQRSMGMSAFVAPEPVERMMRDLGVYLRQPAVDAVLLEAAAWHLAQG